MPCALGRPRVPDALERPFRPRISPRRAPSDSRERHRHRRGADGQPRAPLRLGVAHRDRRPAGPPDALPAPRGGDVVGRAPRRPLTAGRRGRDRGPRCSTPCARIPRRCSARTAPSSGRATCRSCSRCWPPTNRCACRRTPAPRRPPRASPARTRSGIPRRRPEPQLPRRQPQARADLRVDRVPRTRRLPRPVPRPSRCWAHWTSPELAHAPRAAGGQPDADGLRALFTTWITLPQSVLDRVLPALQEACVRLAQAGGEFSRRGTDGAGAVRALPGRRRRARRAAAQPRHAAARARRCTCPRGNLHAYLSGAGVELMANSDNVLRGGLTPKHVDVAELLRVLDFSPGTPPVLRGVAVRRLGPLRHRTRRSSCCAGSTPTAARRRRGARLRAADPAVHRRVRAGPRGRRRADGRRAARRCGWGRPRTRASPSPAREPGTQLFLACDGLAG